MQKAIELAPQFRTNWNYGNAIHDGHMVLGRVALRRGDIEAAKRELLEAGKTPESPQLNSLGPNRSLACAAPAIGWEPTRRRSGQAADYSRGSTGSPYTS